MSETTIFQKIIDRQIPASIVYEDEHCLAFRDIAPQAPTHVVVVPKAHHADVGELATTDPELAARLLAAGVEVARLEGLGDGYRFVLNTGRDGGQTVFHVHLHVLGGRGLAWPPG